MKHALWIPILAVLGTSCLTEEDDEVGTPCARQTDCGEENGYCHINAGGAYTCRRTHWCIEGTCHRDCTASCSPGLGWAYDCSGSGECPNGQSCNRIYGSIADGYFACW